MLQMLFGLCILLQEADVIVFDVAGFEGFPD